MSTSILRVPGLCLLLATPVFAQRPLRILEFRPGPTASPSDVFTITFDRPVVGSIEQAFPPSRVVRFTPALSASFEWRDASTIRVIPLEPLTPGNVYALTIDTAFTALDGTRLAAPVAFRAQVHGPSLIGSRPQRAAAGMPTLDPEGNLLLLYSAPVDSIDLARIRIELRDSGTCGTASVAFRVLGQREPTPLELNELRGFQPREDIAERFFRVVAMQPRSLLPSGCHGDLILPSLDSLDSREIRYPIRTSPPFALGEWMCHPPACLALSGISLRFTAPVRAVDLATRVRFEPPDAFTPPWPISSRSPSGSAGSGSQWHIPARFIPRSTYRVTVDSTLRDVYGRPITGSRELTIVTGDHAPAIGHFLGLLTIPADEPATLRVRHINVDSVELILKPVPESQVVEAMGHPVSWMRPRWRAPETVRRIVALQGPFNQTVVTEVPLPELEHRFRRELVAVQLRMHRAAAMLASDDARSAAATIVAAGGDTITTPMALVQATSLVVHARAGDSEGAVFVTDARTGRPVPDAWVRLRGERGMVVSHGSTDSAGIAVLRPLRPSVRPVNYFDRDGWAIAAWPVPARVVEVTARGERVRGLLQSGYASWRSSRSIWGSDDAHGSWALHPPRVRATIFTDRGIYRPGESLFAGAVLREGTLETLRLPPEGARLRWRVMEFAPFEGRWTVAREVVTRLSRAGTSVDSFQVSPRARLGWYQLQVALHLDGDWQTVSTVGYSVAEYRAPEFLVRVTADSAMRFIGDTARATVSARFLFDAPMGDARVQWGVTFEEPQPWEAPVVRGLPRGFHVGNQAAWWDHQAPRPIRRVTGTDMLDASGRVQIRASSDSASFPRGTRIRYDVAVEDVNRQTITSTATQFMHGSRFYLAMRDSAAGYWWDAGSRRALEVLAVRPNGQRVAGVPVRTAVVRHRWEESRPDGRPTGRWAWVRDTVATDSLVTADGPVRFEVLPAEPGYHTVEVIAQDDAGRPVRSSLAKYAMGRTAMRWGDSPTRLDLVLSSDEHRSGDSAVVAFVSPFDSAEAWVTVERERILWQRRLTVAGGPVAVSMPVTDRFVPNVFVSVLLVNRVDATRLDSLHHRVRRGSAGIRVDAAPRGLNVSVRSERAEYGPADSGAVLIQVRDAAGHATAGAVSIWAVDEGVLSLTGYERPDLLGWFYQPAAPALLFTSTFPSLRSGDPSIVRRMIGLDPLGNFDINRLSEVVVTGATAATGEAPALMLRGNAGSGVRASPVVRLDFRTTAFFRAFLTTSDSGSARVAFTLPDNITTFRVIAVAVSGGDRFGSGESPLIVTRPLVVRAAMPRFVRPGDEILAGAVVNARDARPREVRIAASATGLGLESDSVQRLTLAAGGSEARFRWRASGGDSVRVRLGADDGTERDAVSVSLPVRPDFSPRAHTHSGVVRDTSTVVFVLPPEIDPARSRLTLRIGSSPLPTIEVAGWYLRAYRYACTEQLMSTGRYLVSALTLHRSGMSRVRDARELHRELQRVVDLLQRRQSASGGFGYWTNESWTTPWLSAHVGLLLLEARVLGVQIGRSSLNGLRQFLVASLDSLVMLPDTTHGTRAERARTADRSLADRLAAAHFLARNGDARAAVEAARLLGFTRWMAWEDRIWLSDLLHRSGRSDEARTLLSRAWAPLELVGARVDIPDSLISTGFFSSRIRSVARLLSATLAIEPSHPWLGALVERIVQRARGEAGRWWNTQDHASAAVALSEFTARQRVRTGRVILSADVEGIRSRSLAELRGQGGAVRETTIPLDGLVRAAGDSALLSLRLHAPDGPVYYALTVEEVPHSRPVTPHANGISVERWYERFDDGRTVTELREGELVRVRLRVTVPADREFVAIEDPLPAGLEAVDVSLRTSATLRPFSTAASDSITRQRSSEARGRPFASAWYGVWWSPWEHSEKRDDRVVYFARMLSRGSYVASYVARATTSGHFVRPPAHAEEMYNPGLNGRSEGGWFGVTERR